MADNKFVGFYYKENDVNGYIDNSVSYKENLGSNSANYFKILGKFKEPVTLTYQITSSISSSDNVDQVLRYVIENTDQTRQSINPMSTSSHWPNAFRIADFIQSQFYQQILAAQNTGTTITTQQIRTNIENILIGASGDSSGIVNYAHNVYIADSLQIVVLPSDQSKINYIYFKTTDKNTSEHMQFTMYMYPETFLLDYTPDDPYIYIYYTDKLNISTSDMADAISFVQGEIAGKLINNYRAFKANTYIGGAYRETTFHIWSNRFIPTNNATLLQTTLFRTALQGIIRATEIALSEEQLIEKYPDIFTNEPRVLYCISNNKTISNTIISGNQYLLSNPVQFSIVRDLLTNNEVLRAYDGAPIEILSIDSSNIWVPIIAAGGLTDKIPAWRPTISGIEALSDKLPEDAEYAKVFNRTLSRIINNAYDGLDFNSSVNGSVSSGDPTITSPNETMNYYSFAYKAIEWRVYC